MKIFALDFVRIATALFFFGLSAATFADRGGNPHYGSHDQGNRYNQRFPWS